MSGTVPTKPPSRRPLIGAALLVLALVAALVWLLVDPGVAPERSGPAGRTGSLNPVAIAAQRGALQRLAGTGKAAAESPAAAAAPTPSTAPRAQMPQQLLEKIREEDPLMGEFRSYHERALLDAQGLARYRALLSDPANISAIEQALSSPGAGELTLEEHFHRLMRIDFLKAALTWQQNPARALVLDTVSRIILEDSFTEGQEVERQYALAGGKLELYHLLAEHDLHLAQVVKEKARGTRLEKLVTFLAERDQRLRTLGAHHAEP